MFNVPVAEFNFSSLLEIKNSICIILKDIYRERDLCLSCITNIIKDYIQLEATSSSP
jgi:hypothetical protein